MVHYCVHKQGVFYKLQLTRYIECIYSYGITLKISCNVIPILSSILHIFCLQFCHLCHTLPPSLPSIYYHKYVLVFLQIPGYSHQILMLFKFSRQIYEKCYISNFTKIIFPFGNLVVPRGQTDRQTEKTELIVAFRSLANAPNNTHLYSGNTGVWTGLIIISKLCGLTV
jgi:hypothetical protein